jgi:hypothetical protein
MITSLKYSAYDFGSVEKRVPVASRRVRVASKRVGVASEDVAVASQQVLIGYVSAWNAPARGDFIPADGWNSRSGNRQTAFYPLQFEQSRRCGGRACLATLTPERPARLVWEKRL